MIQNRAHSEISAQESKPSPGSDAGYLCLLALIILLANLPLLFGKTYQDLQAFGGDFQLSVIYAFNLLGDSLRHGWFPLWGSSMGCGEPDLAVYFAAYAYPISMLFSLPAFPTGVIAFYLAHFEMIGIFSFLVFRRLGISRPAAFLAAGWNAMSGYSTWVSQVPSALAPLPWFYLLIYLMMAPEEIQKAKKFLLLVLAMTLMLLSGDPEQIAYSGLFGGLWLICFWLFNRSKFSTATFGLVLLGFALALILSLHQILPTVNFFSRTLRSGKLPYQLYLTSYFKPGFILQAVAGLFARSFINLYFSLIAAGFALWAIFSRGNRRAAGPGLLVLFTVVLLLIMPALGLGKVVYSIPLYSHFIRHYKLGFIIQFLVLSLAGLGADRFLSSLGRSEKVLNAPLIFLCALCLLGFLATGYNFLLLLPLVLVLLLAASQSLRSRPIIVLSLLLVFDVYSYLWRPPYKFFEFKMPRYWPEFEKIAKDSEGKNRVQVFYPALSSLSRSEETLIPRNVDGAPAGEGFDYSHSFPGRDYARLLSLLNPEIEKPAGNIRDIFNFSSSFKTQDFINPKNRRLINMLGLRWLFLENFSIKESDNRSVVFDPKYFMNPALKNGFQGFDLSALELRGEKTAWLSSQSPARFYYQSDFAPGDELSFKLKTTKDPAWFVLSSKNQGQSRLIFAREQKPEFVSNQFVAPIPESSKTLQFFVLKKDTGPAGWVDPRILNPKKTIKYVTGDQPRLFENKEALPRGWIVHEALIFNNREELVEKLVDNQAFKPQNSVLVFNPRLDRSYSEHVLPEAYSCNPSEEKVALKEYSREFIRLSANTCAPGFLVWADQYYPGWKAFINGREQKILHADLCLRALRLTSGDHEIIFRFGPDDFRIGLYSSLAGWLVLLFAGLAAVLQRMRSSS